mgnify:CR=1 FL=1
MGRRYRISALHQLGNPSLSERENENLFGACYRLHGHDYKIEILVSGEIDSINGLAVSRDDLDACVHKYLITQYHKSDLNEHFKNTSGEGLAEKFFEILRSALEPLCHLEKVTVQETRKNRFEFSDSQP